MAAIQTSISNHAAAYCYRYVSSGAPIELVALIKEDFVAARIAIESYRKLVSDFGKAASTSRCRFEVCLQTKQITPMIAAI